MPIRWPWSRATGGKEVRLERKQTMAGLVALHGQDEPRWTQRSYHALVREGYASLFGAVDLGKDVIERGAFARSLRQRGAAGIRMLFQHDPGQPIGSWTEIREDARGLFVRGRLATEVTRAREVLSLLRGGALDGLSIGFKTVRARKDMADGVRRVLEADLWEISVVTFPMQPGARIHAVKSAGLPTVRQFERWLTRDAGLTRGEAQAVIGRGFAALRRERDAAPGNDPDTQLARRIRGATHMLISRKTTMRDMTETGHAPEMKSAPGEISEAFGDFMQAFEAFKDANDQRLSEIESRFGGDVITTEKVDRISQALDAQKRTLDQLSLKQMRPVLGRGGGALPSEHKTAFDAYVRRGDDRQLRALDSKAMSYGSGQDGGYLVPAETEAEIGKRLSVISPIRAIASVKQISAAVLKKPFAATGPAAGWVSETGSRVQTDSPKLTELAFQTMELYAQPAVTQTLLDDAIVDLDAWIAGEVETVFAEQEGAAFVNGDGVSKPKGFLKYTQVADSAWSWNNIGYVASGAAAGLPDAAPSDRLIDLVYALKAGYRQNASWVMNRKTQATIRKLKDADGNYLWQPPAAVGQRAMLMGFPLVEAEEMPDGAANATPIAFGDFARGYLVVDRIGMRVLRDPYSAKPYVLFYTTKRVGGGVQDFEAIKLLKYAVS